MLKFLLAWLLARNPLCLKSRSRLAEEIKPSSTKIKLNFISHYLTALKDFCISVNIFFRVTNGLAEPLNF